MKKTPTGTSVGVEDPYARAGRTTAAGTSTLVRRSVGKLAESVRFGRPSSTRG